MRAETLEELHKRHPFRERRHSHSGQMQGVDANVLVALVGCHRARTVLEVGTGIGETAAMLTREFPELRITTCDPGCSAPSLGDRNKGQYLKQEEIGALVASAPNVRVIKKRFREINFDFERFDLVFIDGDHRDEEIERDSYCALIHLRHPGIIVWHDVVNIPGVLETVERVGFGAIHVRGTWMAYAMFP